KLADFCINRSQSSRWQKLAAVPEIEFEEHIERMREKSISKPERKESKLNPWAKTVSVSADRLGKLQDNLIVPIKNLNDALCEIYDILMSSKDLDLKIDVINH